MTSCIEKSHIGDNMYRRFSISASNKIFQQRVYTGLFNFLHKDNNNVIFSPVNARNISQNLPRLPVPALKQTLEKYLQTVRPHVNDKEFAATSELVKKFCADNGIGAKLQKFLVDKAKDSENWLADWWLHAAYLDFRYPVVVYSSPGLVFPFENFEEEDDRLSYATKLILAAIDYKLQIDRDKIPIDMMGKDPLDMNQYKKVFGTCRIPGLKRDSLEYHPTSTHIAVVNNNHFFKVELFGNNGEVISEKQLFNQLQTILEQSVTPAAPIGILTTDHRDNWGKAYQLLIKDPSNKKSVEEIQKSLFLVSLDGPMPIYDEENRQTTASRQLIHAGGSAGNAGNRWYDKTIQVIHKNLVVKNNTSQKIPDAQFDKSVQRLDFNVNDDLLKEIDSSSVNVDKLADDLEMDCFTFKSFGKEFIKTHKLSPDSFIQIAMQYAFYRIHQTPGAHYESAATRKYIHGRTETIRSCSIESINFAKIMLDSSKSDSDKVNALKAAINSHKKYTVEALNGYGVDRHLLGLKLMALERGEEIHPLYSDPGYVRSAHMRISTSQVATKCDGFMCYGPLVPDGYACCYNPRSNDMNFAVSAFVEDPTTSAPKFREALEKSLLDMHNVLVKIGKSKL
ncbi:carnitine o-acyltransferase [Holotrichia oblita]|uniref:Carnitine o-acyltransferase n=1 Tax=Holotrichia oblita TaxID=644536 RepID=A0ACB9TCD4_HOLOL|nr:carnitine o-acyltransferase [Holotrichia oblita]